MASNSICKIEDCDKQAKGRGYCSMHYQRLLRHGDPLAGRTKNGDAMAFLRDIALPFSGNDCLPWPYAKHKGRGYVRIRGRMHLVYRIICEEINGRPPSANLDVAHSCGNGHLACINPRHLRWASRAQNEADKILHGTRAVGERHGAAKLTEEQAVAIIQSTGSTSAVEARRYGVHESTVRDIRRGRRWQYLTRA